MKVITEFPVYIDSKLVGGTDWLNLDGKNQKQVLDFQQYANKRGANLKEDGLYYREDGKKSNTAKAYDLYGADWEKTLISTPSTGATPPPAPTAPAPTPTQQAEAKKKGFNWDKAKGVWVKAGELGITDKLLGLFGITPQPDSTLPDVSTSGTGVAPTEKKGMSKTTKLVIVGGGILVVGLIIYAATRPKKGK